MKDLLAAITVETADSLRSGSHKMVVKLTAPQFQPTKGDTWD